MIMDATSERHELIYLACLVNHPIVYRILLCTSWVLPFTSTSHNELSYGRLETPWPIFCVLPRVLAAPGMNNGEQPHYCGSGARV